MVRCFPWMPPRSEQVELMIAPITLGAPRALDQWKRFDQRIIPLRPDPVSLKLPPAFKSHQRIFELLKILLLPEDHVSENDRFWKIRKTTSARAPQSDQAYA
jgi:hypothetical protein